MKRVLLLSVLVCAVLVWAQEDWYVAENDEHSSDVTATEIISSEPIIISTIIGVNDPAVADTTPEKDMTASAEMSYSEYSKKINIPLWYRWREYSFNLTVPYFIAKEVDFGMDTKYSVSGIGDITLGTSYGKYLEQYSTYIDGNFSVKMPTGDPEADDDGNIIPLGSDTWDFALAVSGFYFMDDFTFKSTLLYKLNGTYETEMWDGSKQETDVGDLFMFSAGADYRWQYNLTFGLNIVYGNHMASETEGTDNKNALSFIDITPAVKYPISLFEFVLGARIPVMTSAEAHDPDDPWSNQENRNSTIFFRTNYRIF